MLVTKKLNLSSFVGSTLLPPLPPLPEAPAAPPLPPVALPPVLLPAVPELPPVALLPLAEVPALFEVVPAVPLPPVDVPATLDVPATPAFPALPDCDGLPAAPAVSLASDPQAARGRQIAPASASTEEFRPRKNEGKRILGFVTVPGRLRSQFVTIYF